MEYYVYVLRDRDGRLYKGMTNNLRRRLVEHRAGHTVTTSKMHDVELVYSEKFDSLEDAVCREKYLKSAAGRRFLKIKMPT